MLSVVIINTLSFSATLHGTPTDRNYADRQSAADHVIEDVASAQKSIAAVLIGIAQEKGLLDINDPVRKYLGTDWSDSTSQQEAKYK